MEKVRLDKYLAKVLGVPRAQIAHLIDKKMVLVNGVVAKKSEIVGEGDDIKIAESSEKIKSKKPIKSFCYFWLLPKVESPLPLNHNLPNSAESTESQNLVNLNPCEAPENSPASWCKKSESKGAVVPPADFLLEAEKRGSPPKSEKRSFWRVGGAGRGVQPFCEKESELSGENSVRVAESTLDSANSQNLPQIQRLYEDDDILVLNKPPFLATHGAPSLKEPSLVEWLKARKIQRSTISGELREGIVHRLDKQTSGALVVAKNNDAHNALSTQLADKTMGRLYLAIIDLPLKEDIEIECYLARNPKNRLKISKVDMRKYKKFAESSLDFTQNLPKFARYSKSKFYKLLPSKDGKKELILAKLFTGRTHQIRAHLESINRHIVGDELYGYKRGKGEGERVMLHAFLLELTHPKKSSVGNSVLGMQFRTCENFGESTDSSLVLSPKFSQIQKPHRNHFDCDSLRESTANQTEIAESTLDSANPQNLNQNNPRVSANLESRPLRGAKNRIQGCRSATADFLLEAEKLGSPPKSEKRQLLGTHLNNSRGEREQGGAALLRKESNKNSGNEITESSLDSVDSAILSQGGLPRSYTLARNDDSAKLRFIAPLFDDMKDYLAKNFDMEKVYEILHGLPTRAF